MPETLARHNVKVVETKEKKEMKNMKRKIGLLLIACLFTVGIASVYAAGSNPFDALYADFDAFQENVGTTLGQMLNSITGLETDVTVLEDKVAINQFMETIADLEARIVLLEDGGGNPGTPGPEGPEGPMGPLGDTGLQGIQGVKGDTGDVGPAGPGFGVLIYDSGWMTLWPGLKTLCTLDNPTNIFVYMIGKNPTRPIHQMWYGGDCQTYTPDEQQRGAYWNINNNNELRVYRHENDLHWQQVRVMVWQLPS